MPAKADGKTATGVTYIDASGNEVIQPADMAGTVLFLASDASRMMTSQTLLLDGGFVSG